MLMSFVFILTRSLFARKPCCIFAFVLDTLCFGCFDFCITLGGVNLCFFSKELHCCLVTLFIIKHALYATLEMFLNACLLYVVHKANKKGEIVRVLLCS